MDCKFSNLTELTVNVCYFSDDIFPNMKIGYLEQQEGPETHESTLWSNLDSARRAPEIFEDWAFHCYGLISFCEWVSPPAASYVTLEPKSIAAALRDRQGVTKNVGELSDFMCDCGAACKKNHEYIE